MQALGQLSPQAYLQDERILRIFSLLDKTMFVGGCVRDGLIGVRDIYDIDIATETPAQKVMDILTGSGYNVIPTGLKHGTITVVIPPFNLEITTLRVDKETDGRHAAVEFSRNWVLDANRRDFTINSLYADTNGVVYDFLNGTAMEDLSRRKIRFIGFADDRIKEDALRILRFFRFYSRFGGIPNREAVSACRRNAAMIKNLSAERINSEFKKILLSYSPETTLKLMDSCEVSQHIIIGKTDNDFLRQIVWLETHGIRFDEVKPNLLRRLFAMLKGNPDNIIETAKNMKFSNIELGFLQKLLSAFEMSDVKKCKYLFGPEIALSVVLLQWAKHRAYNPAINSRLSEEWYQKVKLCIEFIPPKLPITGKDLLEKGIEPSKDMGKMLEAANKLFIENNYSLNKQDIFNLLGL